MHDWLTDRTPHSFLILITLRNHMNARPKDADGTAVWVCGWCFTLLAGDPLLTSSRILSLVERRKAGLLVR